jgi:hypothetical protein
MTIAKKRPKPFGGNHIRAKGSCDGSASLEKQKKWAELSKKPRKWG